jgi:DNA-directed RNA polymerases I and III subunit RPAC2
METETPVADPTSHAGNNGGGEIDASETKGKVEVIGSDETCLTFTVHGEDHTLGNALRYVLMKNADVEFCGYNIPHPSDNFVNVRVQTLNGISATDAFRKALRDLADMTEHVKATFTDAAREAGARLD